MISVAKENTRLNLALAIPAGVPIMLEKEIIDIPPLVADIYLIFILSFTHCFSFSLISVVK